MPVNVIGTLKPKNGGSFPIVEAIDVFVEGYLSLADAVSHFATDEMISAINIVLNGKANTSDVNVSVTELQAQIDQIVISATAEAVVAPEVAAARVDKDGNTYDTLKHRIDADSEEIDKTKDSIAGLTSATATTEASYTETNITSSLTFSDGAINPTTGEVFGSSTYKHTQKIPVNQGDVFNTSVSFRYVAAYKGDTFKSDLGTDTSADNYTVPDGVDSIILSFTNANSGATVKQNKISVSYNFKYKKEIDIGCISSI